MGSNHPEIQAAVARVRWQRARGVPDPKPKRPGPRVIHQLSVAKEEKLAHATMQAFGVMMSAVRLADLAPQLPNPLHGKIFAAAQEAVELILTGLHDAGLDPPRLPKLSEINKRSGQSVRLNSHNAGEAVMRKRSEDELSDAEYWFQYVRHLLGFMDSMSRVLEEAQDPDSALSAEQRSERIASICKGLKYFAAAMREMGIEPETPEETASYSDDHTENSNHR